MPELPTTELEAVNSIIDTIGEPPVASLSDTGALDVERAKNLVAREKRSLLKRGWWFNVEKATLVPDSDTRLPIPVNSLSVEPFKIQLSRDRYTERNGFIFDRVDGTDTGFTDTFDVRLVRNLTWEELPESAREVIFVAAAEKFLRKTIGELRLAQFEGLDARTALADLKRENLRQRRLSLKDNPKFYRSGKNRRNYRS